MNRVGDRIDRSAKHRQPRILIGQAHIPALDAPAGPPGVLLQKVEGFRYRYNRAAKKFGDPESADKSLPHPELNPPHVTRRRGL
jgi:hypothetical protein